MEPAEKIHYPKVHKSDQVDVFHGTEVPDPYRWMENHLDPELVEWIGKQNEIFQNYIDTDYQKQVEGELTKLFNYERYGIPTKRGAVYYYSKNTGLEKQSKYYRRSGLKGEEELILDPNTLSEDATLAVVATYYSKSGKFVALELSQSGSDWRELKILNLETLEFENDQIGNIRNFANVQWIKDDSGFYYSARVAKEETGASKVWFHKLGEVQSQDEMIHEYEDDENMRTVCGIDHTEKYIFFSHAKSTMPLNMLYYKKIGDTDLIPIASELKYLYSVLGVIDDIAYIRTNENAPNSKIISVDLTNPGKENWKTIIPETDPIARENGSVFSGSNLLINYNRNVRSEVEMYDLKGNKIAKVDFPTYGSVLQSGSIEHSEVFFEFSSFLYPTSIYHYNSSTRTLEVFQKPDFDVNDQDYVVEQVRYPSKDGTMIPMYIMHRKGLVKNGENPTVLYGYGGFNVSLNPALNQFAIHWMDQGGVYALANLRGGGEFGESWHKSGYLFNKQNVFDDFHAAAEYLAREKYTKPSKLASRGGSNGGLLTAATMLQRPELYGAVLTIVGVLDMLRYHLYTIGRYWVPEYGDIDIKEEFENMYKYSPLHNVKEGATYPPTYIFTADFDDRVDTAHSKKYTATLQEKAKGGPFVMRVQTNAGHNAIGKQITKVIEDMSYELAFLKTALKF